MRCPCLGVSQVVLSWAPIVAFKRYSPCSNVSGIKAEENDTPAAQSRREVNKFVVIQAVSTLDCPASGPKQYGVLDRALVLNWWIP